MRYLFCLLLLLSGALPTVAQRIVREREFFPPYGGKDWFFHTLLRTRQGNYLVSGPGDRNPPLAAQFPNTFLLLSPTLDTLWSRRGTTQWAGDQFIEELPNGEFAFAATYNSGPYPGGAIASEADYLLQRLTPLARPRWSRVTDLNLSQNVSVGLVVTADGGAIVAGVSSSRPRSLFQFYKTDSLGARQWVKNYGWGPQDHLFYLARTGRNRLVAAGESSLQLKFLQLNEQGDSLRALRLAPLGPGRLAATTYTYQGLHALRDGGVLLTSRVDSAGQRVKLPLLVRLDSLLQPRWTLAYRPQPLRQMLYTQALELQDGSLLVLLMELDTPHPPTYYLHHVSAAGRLLRQLPVQSALPTYVEPYRLLATATPQQVLVAGRTLTAASNGAANGSRAYIALLDLTGLGLPAAVVTATAPAAVAAPPARLQVFPNPATRQATVRYPLPAGRPAALLVLHDARGRRVRTQVLPPGGETRLDLTGLPAGVYALQLLADGLLVATSRLAVQ